MAGSIGSHDPGGFSTSGGVCWTDPADMAGQVNSIQERLAKIEQILSLLCGMDITAAQLSDITSSAGMLTDFAAILSNVNGGWITDGTFTGVAISSLGWTMSDGNTYPIVSVVDGVLQYGFTNDGQFTGSAAAASVYGIFNAGFGYGGTTLAEPDQVYFKGVTRLNQEFSTASSSSIIQRTETWRVDSAGLYLVTMAGASKISGNTIGIVAYIGLEVLADTGSPQLSHETNNFKDHALVGNGYTVEDAFTVPWRANAGDEITLSFTHSHSGGPGVIGTYHAIAEQVSVIKVGSLT